MSYLEIAALGRRPRPGMQAGISKRNVDQAIERQGYKIESAGPGKMAARFLCAIRDRSTALWRSLSLCFQPDIAKASAESIAAKCFAIVDKTILSGMTPDERKPYKDDYCKTFSAEYKKFRSPEKKEGLSCNAAIFGAHGLALATIQHKFPDDLLGRLKDIDKNLREHFAIETRDIASAKDWTSIKHGGLRHLTPHPTFDIRNLTFDLRHSTFDVRHAAFDNSTQDIS